MSSRKRARSAGETPAVAGATQAKKPKIDTSGLEPSPEPSLGYKTYPVKSMAGWNKVFTETFSAAIRPAMTAVSVAYSPSPGAGAQQHSFTLSFGETPKDDASGVKINALYKHDKFQDFYYSKQNNKYSAENSRTKLAFDAVPKRSDEAGLAKDTIRVMKGEASTKGLSSTQQERALHAGSLIMTSERERHPFNPINAQIELYKVKHGQQALGETFHPKTGTFVAARKGGAEASRKAFDTIEQRRDYVQKGMTDKAMQEIWKTHASLKPKYKDKTFEEWANQKFTKWNARYKTS